MRTERFDEEIRRKMENAGASFQQEEVDRVYHEVSQRKKASSGSTYMRTALFALGLLAIGLFAWNITQLRENKRLLETVNGLQADAEKAERIRSTAHTDTVYITQDNSSPSADHKAEGKFEPGIPGFNRPENSVLKNQAESDAARTTVEEIAGAAQRTSDFRKNSAAISQPAGDIPASADKERSNGLDSVSSQSAAGALTHTAGPEKIQTDTNGTLAAKTADPGRKDSLHDDYQKQPIHSSFFANWNYRAGVGVEKSDDQEGFSLLAGIGFNKFWSLSTGVKLLVLHNEKYENGDEFYLRQGQSFESIYGSRVSDASAVKEIKIRDNLICVPILLSYHIPLKNNFSFLCGAGTDMVLHARQYVQCEQSLNSNEAYKSFKLDRSVLVFSNLTLSAGIEKAWRRFAWQLNVYTYRQVLPVFYKDEDLDFGVRIKMLYAFGK